MINQSFRAFGNSYRQFCAETIWLGHKPIINGGESSLQTMQKEFSEGLWTVIMKSRLKVNGKRKCRKVNALLDKQPSVKRWSNWKSTIVKSPWRDKRTINKSGNDMCMGQKGDKWDIGWQGVRSNTKTQRWSGWSFGDIELFLFVNYSHTRRGSQPKQHKQV